MNCGLDGCDFFVLLVTHSSCHVVFTLWTQQLNASISAIGDVNEMQEDVQKAVEEMVRLRLWVLCVCGGGGDAVYWGDSAQSNSIAPSPPFNMVA